MSNQFEILLLLGFAWHVRTTLSQLLPPISCPEYFEYINREELYSGKITLRDLPFDTINLQVKFSQRVPIESNFRGRLSFEHDLLMTQKKMESGEPITYLVEFPLPYVLPKLIRIVVNGMEVCSAPDYPDPRTTFGLQRSFTPAAGTHRRENGYTATSDKDASSSVAPEGFRIEQPLLWDTPTKQITSHGYESVCGREADGSIIKLREDRIPWLARIYKIEEEVHKYQCSGSLISSLTILTSAYCVTVLKSSAESARFAVLGNLITSGIMTHRIKTLIKYPNYADQQDANSDIALLILGSAVTFTPDIRPICLWTDVGDANIDNKQGSVTARISPQVETTLFASSYIVNMTVISLDECLMSNKKFNSLPRNNVFCARSQDSTGSCRADTGDPVAFDHLGRWMLRGFLSRKLISASESCLTAADVFFSDVSKYANWILANMLK